MTVTRLDSPDLFRVQIRPQGTVGILTVLDTKRLVAREPSYNGLDLLSSDGNYLLPEVLPNSLIVKGPLI